MRVKSQKDFFSGLMFMAVGVAFAWGSSQYSIGTGARMGPGYFPLVLGLLLALLGGVITFKSLVVETLDGDKVGRVAWRPLVCVVAANLVFGVALGGLPDLGIPVLGMVVGVYALTLIASLANDAFKLREALLVATALAMLSYLVFVVLLKLQFPVWPAFVA